MTLHRGPRQGVLCCPAWIWGWSRGVAWRGGRHVLARSAWPWRESSRLSAQGIGPCRRAALACPLARTLMAVLCAVCQLYRSPAACGWPCPERTRRLSDAGHWRDLFPFNLTLGIRYTMAAGPGPDEADTLNTHNKAKPCGN